MHENTEKKWERVAFDSCRQVTVFVYNILTMFDGYMLKDSEHLIDLCIWS